jgi:beta-glucosidase
LKLSKDRIKNQEELKVTVDIKNTGDRTGDEIIQLYIKDMFSSVTTYESQLRGFERVSLNPDETKTISFTIKPQDLELLDKNMNWTVEPGEFEVRIGASSEDIKLTKKLTVD